MNPVSYTVTGTGSGRAVNLDYRQNPFSVGISCILAGTGTYSVEHTYDNIYSGSFNAATATWYPNSILNGQTSTAEGFYTTPVSAVRGNMTAATGTASVSFIFIQATQSP